MKHKSSHACCPKPEACVPTESQDLGKRQTDFISQSEPSYFHPDTPSAWTEQKVTQGHPETFPLKEMCSVSAPGIKISQNYM